MKKLAMFLILGSLVVSAKAQDYLTWTLSPLILQTEDGLVFRHEDPENGDIVFVKYVSLVRETKQLNVFSSAYSKEGEECYFITRNIRNGRSVNKKVAIPCRVFDQIEESYQRNIPKPLEEL